MRSVIFLIALWCGVAMAGDLPDPQLTPGVVSSDVRDICTIKWGKDARHVTEKMKAQIAAGYMLDPKSCQAGKIEFDHLIPRELMGADDVLNVWEQCYEDVHATPRILGAHAKDELENRLHSLVCSGQMTLPAAQSCIKTDWIKCYHTFVN